MVAGHFAERHFAERHLAERHFAERTFCRRTLSRTDILSNGQYDERTFRRKDILPKRQLAENREILGIVTHFSKMCNSQSLCNYKITIVRLDNQNGLSEMCSPFGRYIVHFLSNECVALIRVLVK